jgi:hypothetical protein
MPVIGLYSVGKSVRNLINKSWFHRHIGAELINLGSSTVLATGSFGVAL